MATIILVSTLGQVTILTIEPESSTGWSLGLISKRYRWWDKTYPVSIMMVWLCTWHLTVIWMLLDHVMTMPCYVFWHTLILQMMGWQPATMNVHAKVDVITLFFKLSRHKIIKTFYGNYVRFLSKVNYISLILHRYKVLICRYYFRLFCNDWVCVLYTKKNKC